MNFFKYINPRNIPKTIDPDDEVLVFRERILQYILLVCLVIGLFELIPNLPGPIQRGQWVFVVIYVSVYLGVVFLALFRNLPYQLRAGLTMAVMYILGVSSMMESGLSGDSRVFLLIFTILTATLLGLSRGLFAGFLAIATMEVIGWLMSSGKIPLPPFEVLANSNNFLEWITAGLATLLMGAITIAAIIILINGLQRTAQKEKSLSIELARERDLLEQRIELRTQELQKRASQLEAASEIAQDVSKISNLEDLLPHSVDSIRDRFGYYHAGLFLLDERNEYAVLRAATGEAGRAMLAGGHRLRIGEVGLVGYVVAKGEPRIALDVGSDPFHFKNPLLPFTRSEMTLPLKVGDQIIGALDVQSEKQEAFSLEDTRVLQIIADQLAVAIEKARIVDQLQQNMSELELSYQQFTRKAWRSHLKGSRRNYAYRYRMEKIEIDATENPDLYDDLQHSDPIIKTLEAGSRNEKPVTTVAIPIKLRNQIIGIVDVQFESQKIPGEMVSMLETITDRLAFALENARLLEENQNRAEREKLIGDISAKVRASTNLDNVLRIAAAELGQSLGISEVLVQLKTTE
jgi:GAF domain-containing protein